MFYSKTISYLHEKVSIVMTEVNYLIITLMSLANVRISERVQLVIKKVGNYRGTIL